MAQLEIQPHWIDEVCRERRGKVTRPLRYVTCDACAAEGRFPPLHPTLYRVHKTKIYFCEIHAMLNRRKPPTLEFARIMKHIQQPLEGITYA